MLLLLLIACSGPPTSPAPPVTDSSVWFVEVAGEGGYWLEAETLRTVGVDPSGESPPTLRLSWADRIVPHMPFRTEEGWGVYFFAPDQSTRYTRRTALRLEVGVPGEVIPSEQLPQATAAPAGGLTSLRWEQDLRYLPQADASSPWFWESLYAPGAVTHTLVLTDAVPGPVSVTVALWSHTHLPANPDHLLRLRWDTGIVGEWKWDGEGMQYLTASWDEGRLKREHTLTVESLELPGVDVAVVWLDGWEVTYRSRVQANGGVWEAEGTGLRVDESSPRAYVLDVTDPLAPLELGAIPATGVVGTVSGHRYWIGVPHESPGPLALRRAVRLDADALKDTAYLALAPSEFHAALDPLLKHRRGQGLEVALVDPQGVYDTFGSGRPGVGAVQALVQSLPALRYLLLVGDGASEPWGYDGEEGALRVVAPVTRTVVLGETPADALFGVDQQERPTVAVGRFPASSPTEASAMVEKTIQWETSERPMAFLIVSDDEPQFAAMADEIASRLSRGEPVDRVDAGDESSREKVLEALEVGPTWLHFTGHGSLTRLCDEGLLTVEDGASWHEPTLVVAWTCLAAHFVHPAQQSMAEAWVRSAQGGVVAFLGPVGETTAAQQAPLVESFYRAIPESERLGDAWLAALQGDNAPDVAWGYVLLGDPALRLRLE